MGILSGALTDEEYAALDWFPLLEGTQWDHYRWAAAKRLLDKAKEIEADQPVLSEAFQVLGWVVAFQSNEPLSPPYGPMLQGSQGRSGAMEDMGPLDADFLARVARDTTDPWLRARFADVAVTLGPSTGPDWELGKISVQAQLDYLRSVFLTERAIEGMEECRRALRLLWVYAKRDQELGDAYWDLIRQQVRHGLDNSWPGIVFPLCDEAMQRNREACREFAPLLVAKGDSLVETFPQEAERYFEYASRLWNRLGQSEKARQATQTRGEALVRAAESVAEHNSMLAPHFLVQGISVLRRGRAPPERIAALRELLARYQLASLDAYKQHEFRMDVSDWIKYIDAEVIGPSFFEGLLQVGLRLGRWLNFDQIRQEVLGRQRGLASFFDTQHANEEGAVVSTTPALDPNNEESVFQRMVSQARETHLSLHGRVFVDHATGILYSNFQPTFSQIKEIVDDSPMTPEGYSETLSRGFYAGICDDWVAASAFLIPSVEPLVRSHLRRRGIHTTAIRDDGTQQERTLSELLAMPQAEQVFGKGLLFELRVLLTEPNGFNLRNGYCHGLMRDEQLRNAGIMCLWWSLLRIILFPWREHPAVASPPREDPGASIDSPSDDPPTQGEDQSEA